MPKLLTAVILGLGALVSTLFWTKPPRLASPPSHSVRVRSHQAGPTTEPGGFMSGVVEGFYGNRWTVADTDQILSFMAQVGLNTFVYAPKNDPYQRAEWNTLYPPAALQYLKSITAAAAADHVHFVYSVSPGLSIVYANAADRAALVAKVNQIRAFGVHTFMLSFDDIGPTLDPVDARVYHDNLARAQASLANYLYSEETASDPAFQLIFTPTDYYGLVDGPYWESLKTYLNPHIDVVWTGPWVLSAQVTGAQARLLRTFTGHPIVFWDNYPVNDWTYVELHHPRLFMGPVTGRSADLPSQLAGYLVNPMLQARASEVALYTTAAYLRNPAGYQPWVSWLKAVQLLGGPATNAFQLFCQDSRGTFLKGSQAGDPVLIRDLAAFAANPAHPSAALLTSLAARFQAMAAVDQTLATGLPDHVLYTELQPWSANLSLQGTAGLAAVQVLQDRAAGRADVADLARLTTLVGQLKAQPVVLDTTSAVRHFLQTVESLAGGG